jgi:hypothetical protein
MALEGAEYYAAGFFNLGWRMALECHASCVIWISFFAFFACFSNADSS